MKHTTLKISELIKESGFRVDHIAEKVLGIHPTYLSRCLNSEDRNLSPIREKLLRDYLEKVSQVPKPL